MDLGALITIGILIAVLLLTMYAWLSPKLKGIRLVIKRAEPRKRRSKPAKKKRKPVWWIKIG